MEILPQPNSEYLVDGKYSITDLIDINRVQSIFDKFSLATGFTIGLLDHPGMRILAQAGWRDICTKFHRAKEDSAKICAVSNQRLMNNLNNPGKPTIEACEHGLIDCAVPILIKDVHIGSLATGQLLMQSVDPEQFKQQAKKYGYDEEAYLKALSDIPVISEQELNNVTLFMGEIASLISEMGYANLVIKEESEKMEQELAEHRRLESALSESEIRYETLFRGAVEGILAADIKTRKFVFANPAICRMLGYSEDELKRLGVNDIHPPDSLQMVSEAFEGLVKGNISSPVEVPCLKKDGSIIYADINSNQIMIKDRHILVGFFTDITARKRMNDELQTSLTKLKLTIDEAPICVITTGFDRRILSCNKAFCNMLGYTERELKEKTFTDITYTDDLHIGIDIMPAILEGKKKKSVIQKRYVRKDGGLVWVEIQINLVRDNQGEPWYFMSIIQDITERKLAEEQLRETNELLSLFIKNSPIYTYIKEVTPDQSKVIFASENFLDMTGVAGSRMIGKTMMEFFPKDFAKKMTEDDWNVVSSGQIINLDEELYGRSFTTIKFPISIGNKKLLAGYTIDITERKKVENALRNSEQYSRLIVDNAPFGAHHYELREGNQLIFIGANPAADQILGVNNKQFIGKTIEEAFPSLAKTDIPDAYRRAAANGEQYDAEQIEYKDDRIQGAFEVHAFQTSVNHVAVFFIDITERKTAEEALMESEKRYRSLFATSPSGIIILDENGIILEANKEVYKSVIYSPEEFIGKHISILSGNENIPEINENIRRIFSGETLEQEVVNCTKDGFIRYYMLRETAITLPNGKKGILSVSNDITERRKAENIIMQNSIEIEHQNEESDRLKSAFLANMSHEIRTPMNGILSFASLLKNPQLTGEKQLEYVRIIESSGDRMLNIINDLICISKIEAGMSEVILSNSSINEQIEYLYYFFKPEVEKKGMDIFFSNTLPLRESIIYTDREKIYAILTNLVKNAIKFTREGYIEFGYKKKGDFLEFFVKDTGIGITPDQKEIIFERFRQGSESLSRSYEGAGLGLSISKMHIEMLGGEIWVESEPLEGTTFYFTTPYVTNVGPSHSDTSEPKKTIKPLARKKKLKILIAEDDEASDIFLSITLQKYSPEILHAVTGTRAVELCKSNPDMDLVLMDIKMTEMDGYEATRQIRQFNKDIVIIAQTAYAIAGDREKSIDAGCNDHITKPIKAQKLLEIIRKYFKL